MKATQIGELGGNNIYRFESALSSTFDAVGNEPYMFGVEATSATGNQPFYWMSGNGGDGTSKQFDFNDGNVTDVSRDRDFQLNRVQKITLDFDTALDRNFSYVYNSDADYWYVSKSDGSMSTLDGAGDAFKDELVEVVQQTFYNAGIQVDVAHTRDQDDGLRVRFSENLISVEAGLTLYGDAYDIGGLPGGLDQFNQRSDGEMAVFMNPEDYSVEDIAHTVTHEIGHALGLRHISRDDGSFVMESGVVPDAQFSAEVSAIADPGGGTHNPSYHLNKYVNGDAAAAIFDLEPGTWDEEQISEETNRSFVFYNSLEDLSDLTVLVKQETTNGDVDVWEEVASFDTIDGLGEFQFDVFETELFMLTAKSDGSLSNPDVYFGISDGQGRSYQFSGLADGVIEGHMFLHNSTDGTVSEVGAFGLTTVSVPEPSSTSLLLVFCFVLTCKRSRSANQNRAF